MTEQDLQSSFQRLRAAAASDPYPDRDRRRQWLRALLDLTERHEQEFIAAIDADFGGRSGHETRIAELAFVRAGINHALSHLSSWMRTRRIATKMIFWPGSNRLHPQPLGVVGIVSPWNYPFQLALAPATAALAAGNRVLIKPSELTPTVSGLLARLVAKYFPADVMTVIPGDADVGKAFVALPFDHLLFTGSTPVGRLVAQAAARNLTPVTLELGGKSPAIIDESADLDRAVSSISYGKLLNAGQTCIAPDYLLVPTGQARPVAERIAARMARLYPRLVDNPDYTAIVSHRHYRRLSDLVDEARDSGADIIEVNPAREASGNSRKFLPKIVIGAAPGTRLMNEEIFGPVLPIVEYGGIDAAVAYVNGRDRPLALYWFGRNRASKHRILRETTAGGVTINDCLMHIAQENQPFGGVGASGMGAYHGVWGFRAFSKDKPVFEQARLNGGGLLHPPYGARFEQVMRLFRLMT